MLKCSLKRMLVALCVIICLGTASFAIPQDKEKHMMASSLITCYLRDHGWSVEQTFLTTLAICAAWEITNGWNADSSSDLFWGVTGSLLTLSW